MKNCNIYLLASFFLFLIPNFHYGQAPNLGTTSNFVLFSTNGAVSNTGFSHLTGHVGTNNGSSTAFGNVDGVMHDQNGTSAQARADLLVAYNQLNATIPNYFPAPLLGNNDTLRAGVYSISGAATLNLNLILNAQGNLNAVFIFQIQGAFAANANSKIILVNGAQACKVFWKIEGQVSLASGAALKGTIIANNAAIIMNSGVNLEGRALSTTGAITIDGITAYTPIGCGNPLLTGPSSPSLSSAACFGIFSGSGPVTNAGVTFVTGDVGTNVGLTTGFNPLNVTGVIHPIPDGATASCASDLLNAYNFLNVLPADIELLYPAQLGNSLVLTPHTYVMNGAAILTDTLFLNAQNNSSAVFVIKLNGALSTSTYSTVVLQNGAQAKNVYWKIDGAVHISDYSVFKGTIICNNGAVDLNFGVTLDGRALTTTGSLNTSTVNVNMPLGCGQALSPIITSEPVSVSSCAGNIVNFSVAATGSGLSYQWRKGSVLLTNGGNIFGANSPTLTFNPVQTVNAGTNYNVIVTGSAMPSDTSQNAALVVNSSPIVSVVPSNQFACSGASASFSIVATGTGLTYQWRKGTTNLINGTNITGANTATLVINPVGPLNAAIDYNVVITGTCSPNYTSPNVSLIVNVAPSISVQPVHDSTCVEGSASFSVVASGSGLSYQWRKGATQLMNGGNISGANSATLLINSATALNAGSNYNVWISGVCSPSITSSNATLTINLAPSITTNPINQIACDNLPVSFSVISSGTNLNYQWRRGQNNLSNTANITGTNTSILGITLVGPWDTASDYNVVITGACSPAIVSPNASLSLCNSTSVSPFAENQLGNSFNVYPNPFEDYLKIGVAEEFIALKGEFRMYDALGICI